MCEVVGCLGRVVSAETVRLGWVGPVEDRDGVPACGSDVEAVVTRVLGVFGWVVVVVRLGTGRLGVATEVGWVFLVSFVLA